MIGEWVDLQLLKQALPCVKVKQGTVLQANLSRTGRRGLEQILSRKKRSSQDTWYTCSLGTPFPRSALFLKSILRKFFISHKITDT
jgi:hypothetical protein